MTRKRTEAHPKMPRLRASEFGCFFLVFIALAYVRVRTPNVIQDGLFADSGCPKGKADLAVLAALLHVSFPSAAFGIDSYQVGNTPTRCEIYVRFEISARYIGAFLASTRIETPLAPQAPLSEFRSIYRQNRWQPNSNIVYQCGQSKSAPDYAQSVCVDTSYDADNIVYLTVDYRLAKEG